MLAAIIVAFVWLTAITFGLLRTAWRIQVMAEILTKYLDNQNELNQQFQLRLGGEKSSPLH